MDSMNLGIIACAALLTSLTACNSENPAVLGNPVGSDGVTGNVQPTPPDSGNGSPAPNTGTGPEIGESCTSDDPAKICLALKYVVYKDSTGKAVVTENQALENLTDINSIWSQCNIGFQIDKFAVEDPTQYGLNYATQTLSELTRVRSAFEEDSSLTVVTTGTWGGSLGAGAANAWATMPGSNPSGVVLEAPVGTTGNLIAHELGHMLNLDHGSSSSDVMSAIIYQGSIYLSQSQCSAARAAAAGYWKAGYS